MRNQFRVIAAIVVLAVSAPAAAFASELVYHPVNPTFGGNQLNGTFLLSQAQAQGEGVKSGSQGPDLSGLTNALGNLGSSGAVIIGGAGTGGTGTGTGGTGTGGAGTGGGVTSNSIRMGTGGAGTVGGATTNLVRAMIP